MRVRSLITTAFGAHSSVGYAATFSIIEKAYEATANILININLLFYKDVFNLWLEAVDNCEKS